MKTQDINEVKEFLKSKNFYHGISILAKYRKGMARILQNQGPKRMTKLEYELKNLAGIDKIQVTVTPAKPHKTTPTAPLYSQKPATAQKQPATGNQQPATDNQKPATGNQQKATDNQQPATTNWQPVDLSKAHKSLDEIPPEIEAIAKEHARLFMLRSQLAEKREKLPDSNKPDIVKYRKMLNSAIHEISSSIEQLYEAHKDYMQNRQMPDMDTLFPNLNTKQQTPNKKQQTPNPKPQTTNNLKKQRSNLMSANRRDRITLNYQSSKKKAKKNPMPEGNERKKIEERIKKRLQEIETLEKQIKEANTKQ